MRKNNPFSPAPAGFRRRLLALLIDLAVVYFLGLFINFILGVNPFQALMAGSMREIMSVQKDVAQSMQNPLLAYVKNVLLLFTLIYTVGSWLFFQGATLGKKILGLKVVKVDGSALDLKTALLRLVGYLVSTIPLFSGFVWVIFDKEKRGFHDKIAGTKVVRVSKGHLLWGLLAAFSMPIFLVGLVGTSAYRSMQVTLAEMKPYKNYDQALKNMKPEAKEHWDKAQQALAQTRNEASDQKRVSLIQEAIGHLTTASTFDDGNPRIWAELGSTYNRLTGESYKNSASQAFQKACQLENDNIVYSNMLANFYLQRQLYAQAKDQFEKSFALNDYNGQVYFGLAMAYQGLGDKDKARAYFDQALDYFETFNATGEYDDMIQQVKDNQAKL